MTEMVDVRSFWAHGMRPLESVPSELTVLPLITHIRFDSGSFDSGSFDSGNERHYCGLEFAVAIPMHTVTGAK